MAWGFRRSFNLGPLRINASKSGIGYSVGGRGLRIGKDARGRSYTNVSLPGTGISNRTYSKSVGSKRQGSYTSTTQQNTQTTPSRANGRVLGQVLVYGLAAVLLYAAISFLLHLL